jgi:hypothetical protein
MATKKKPTTNPTEQKEYAKPHQLMLMSTAQNASAMEKFSVYGDVDMSALVTELQERVKSVQDGDVKPLEAMLYGQAQALQSIFTNMARRSVMNAGEYINASETYMKLALRAQSQCRATLETLAIVKNPMPYIKQANIANGPQQVNNGMPAPTHAGNSESQQSKLLEDSNGSTYLDTGAAPAAARSNPAMETVDQVHWAKKPKG